MYAKSASRLSLLRRLILPRTTRPTLLRGAPRLPVTPPSLYISFAGKTPLLKILLWPATFSGYWSAYHRATIGNEGGPSPTIGRSDLMSLSVQLSVITNAPRVPARRVRTNLGIFLGTSASRVVVPSLITGGVATSDVFPPSTSGLIGRSAAHCGLRMTCAADRKTCLTRTGHAHAVACYEYSRSSSS